jgi:sulfur-oxidizing protein SoxB
VAGWAPVAEANKNAGPPIWDVVETYLKANKTIAPIKLNTPRIIGVEGNPGIA